MKNPKNQDIGQFLIKLSYFLWSSFVAADSGFILWTIIKAAIKDAFSNTAANWIASIITVAYITSVELVLIFNLGKRFGSLAQGKAKGSGKAYAALFTFMVLLSAIAGAISIEGRTYAAETIITPPTLPNTAERTNKATTSLQNNVDNLQLQLNDLEKAAKTAKANAGSAQLRSLAAGGNAWAGVELSRLQQKAVAPYQLQIAEVNKALSDASAAITATVSSITNTDALETTTLLASYSTAKNTVSGFMQASALVCIALMWITAALYAYLDAADGSLDGVIGTPPPLKPIDNDDNNDNGNGSPRRAPKANLVNRQPPVVEYYAPVSAQAQKPETIVITRDSADNDKDNYNVIAGGFEIDGFKFYQADNDRIIKVVTPSGNILDETGCRQYINNYTGKYKKAVGTGTKERLAKLVDSFTSAMHDIDWPK